MGPVGQAAVGTWWLEALPHCGEKRFCHQHNVMQGFVSPPVPPVRHGPHGVAALHRHRPAAPGAAGEHHQPLQRRGRYRCPGKRRGLRGDGDHRNLCCACSCPSRRKVGRGCRTGWEPLSLMPALPLIQLYQKLHDKMEDYQQKVSVATRDHLYRRN